jgi:hypothetical protein
LEIKVLKSPEKNKLPPLFFVCLLKIKYTFENAAIKAIVARPITQI